MFGTGLDPVQLGVVASFNRPGGNATGVYSFGTEVNPKRLELLREILPQLGLIAFFVGPENQAMPEHLRQWQHPPRRSDSPSWFCTAATRMKSRRRSRQWPNARSAVFFSVRPVFPGDRRQARRTRRPLSDPRDLRMARIRRRRQLDEAQPEPP
jgi:hypothetical protein